MSERDEARKLADSLDLMALGSSFITVGGVNVLHAVAARLKDQAEEIERLLEERNYNQRYTDLGKSMLSMIEGMCQPEITEGSDAAAGYIKVWERLKADNKQLRGEYDEYRKISIEEFKIQAAKIERLREKNKILIGGIACTAKVEVQVAAEIDRLRRERDVAIEMIQTPGRIEFGGDQLYHLDKEPAGPTFLDAIKKAAEAKEESDD